MSTAILGLNAFHGDASAALLVDGAVVAAAEEERFTREKHAAGFPRHAIDFCLRAGGLSPSDLSCVAINSAPRARASAKLAFALTRRPSAALLFERLRTALARSGSNSAWPAPPGGGVWPEVRHVEHHHAHLASAFFATDLEQAHCASVDGFGDFASAAWGVAEGGRISVSEAVLFPHSLGIFYQAMTQYLGFPRYGDEYKLMGLSAYGDAGAADDLGDLLRVLPDGRFELGLDYFRHHREAIGLGATSGEPLVPTLYSAAVPRKLGPARAPEDAVQARHQNLAAAVQQRFENALLGWLARVRDAPVHRDLTLAGGCAMNSLAVGRIVERMGYDTVNVPPAAGDAGGALGAAWVAYAERTGRRPRPLTHAYLGPDLSEQDVRDALASYGMPAQCKVEWLDEAALIDAAVRAIDAGMVVAWARGPMEWGARALGNRSILGDPRRADMRERLNARVKLREPFRPFAPSVMSEFAAEWFECAQAVPFMTHVAPVRTAKRGRIPAVVHVDGTARLQTVSATSNPRYHALLRAFNDLTGVPMLLNTSFNENEPIVRSAAEALDCFMRTQMDLLVLGNCVITRVADDAAPVRANIC